MSAFRRNGSRGVAWKPERSALRLRVRNGQEGWRDQKRRLGAEHKGLRVRGLAVGSSQLPWARIQLAANVGPVKGLVGLDSDGVCSRGARSPSDLATPKPGTVAPSAARRPVGGGGDGPAGSIGGRPMARRSARRRAGGTGVAAPSAGVRPKPRRSIPRGRTPHAAVRRRRPRVSAQRANPDFFAATVPGAKRTSRPRSGARASGFAAPPAVRRCGG
jgi:hypothetical protein